MKKILLVEDDRLIAKVYEGRLAGAGMHVDVAHTGEGAFQMLGREMPDFVLLDLMLPGVNGIEVIKAIRSKPSGADVPIVVFSNAFLRSTTEAAYRAGATQCLRKDECTPSQVIQLVEEFCRAKPSPTLMPADSNGESQYHAALKNLRNSLLNGSTEIIAKIRGQLQALSKSTTAPDRMAGLAGLYRQVHMLASNAAVAGFHSAAQQSSALEGLVKELEQKPEKLTPSTLRTIAQALDTLPHLLGDNPTRPVESVQPLVLVLDDDKFSRQAVCSSLAKAGLRGVCAGRPEGALELASDNVFDLIFLDVEMPGLNGFEVCARLRASGPNSQTPVVFVTNLTDFSTRAESIRSGGADVIAKPFLLTELAVKALTWLSRKQAVLREAVAA